MGATIRLQWIREHDYRVVDMEEMRREKLPRMRLDDDPALARSILDDLNSPGPGWPWIDACSPEAKREVYTLEGVHNGVYLALANVKPNTESVLAFTKDWGPLTTLDTSIVSVRRVIAQAALMREAIGELQRSPRAKGLDVRLAERGLHARLHLALDRFNTDSAPRVFLRADDLLQFCIAELLMEGREIRSCPRCGTMFATGKVGKPPLYCSDACKVAMHRKKKREAELRANVIRQRRGARLSA
jgi:hypothetical protein